MHSLGLSQCQEETVSNSSQMRKRSERGTVTKGPTLNTKKTTKSFIVTDFKGQNQRY
jgi:hypothetical protein